MARQPMRIEIGNNKSCLKEDETGNPDSGRSSQCRQYLFGRDWLDQEKKERGQKDGAAEERS
jgi:hypothetical protein